MEITPALLKKYNEGLCTSAEKQLVDDWLDQQEEEEDFPLPDRMSAIGQQIWQEIDPVGNQQTSTNTNRVRYLRIGMAAAAVLAIAVAALVLYSGNPGQHSARTAVSTVTWKIKTTGRGQKLQLQLPDSSLLVLNDASSVRYPESFTDSTRTIYITGEAWLEVAKNAQRPFIVHTPATVIRVLGTAFDVQAYGGDQQTVITVAEGKVSFETPGKQALLLTAGQQGSFLRNGSLQQQNVYAANYTAWRNNQLILADKALPDIAATLQRWYNVEVRITNDALRREHFTGEFDHAPLEQVLKQIAFVIKCHYKIEHEKVTIY